MADDAPADQTARKVRGVPFEPGKSGNPAGRPKGARSKLGEAFVAALHDDFALNGVAAIARVRDEHPEHYVRTIASLLPKELKIETTSDLTDEQLDARIRQLASLIEIGVGGPPGGASAQAEQDEALSVQALREAGGIPHGRC